jgi:hypothetical protein
MVINYQKFKENIYDLIVASVETLIKRLQKSNKNANVLVQHLRLLHLLEVHHQLDAELRLVLKF